MKMIATRATCLVDTKVLELGGAGASPAGWGSTSRRRCRRLGGGAGSSRDTLRVDYEGQKDDSI